MKVGDEVRVYESGRGRHRPGTITKIGRSLVTISGEFKWQTTVFRLDTQQENTPNPRQWFKTMGEVELAEREKVARAALQAVGIEVGYRARLSLEHIEELAAVVNGWDQQ